MEDIATELDAVGTDSEEGGGREVPGRGRMVRGEIRISVVRAVRAKPSGEGRRLARTLTTASKQVAGRWGQRVLWGARACTLFMLILPGFKVPVEATTGQPSRRWGSGFGPGGVIGTESKGTLEAFWEVGLGTSSPGM